MAHIRRLIQTRPNINVNFFTPGEGVSNLINTYISSGKILESYTSTTSDDNLSNTISIKFNNETSWYEFANETIAIESKNEKNNYCELNSISWSVENVEDNT